MGKYIEVSKSQVRNLNDLTRYEFDSRYVANSKGEVFLIKSETPTKYICLVIDIVLFMDQDIHMKRK